MTKKKTIEEKIDDLAAMTARGFADVDKRFEQVDKRFDEMDKRFDEIDKRFDRLEFLVNGHDHRIDVLEDKMLQVARKIGLRFN